MTWFEIAETSEWTKDRELYESALEAGLSACEFHEDDLQRRCVRQEEELDKLRSIVQEHTKMMIERLENLQSAEHPLHKNMQAHGIFHDIKALRRAFGL